MFRLILFIFLIIPFTSYCQCNLNTYVQGNVIPGTDSLLCHGYTTQINVNNLSGISPFICKLEDKLSSQIIQVDTVNSVFNIFNNNNLHSLACFAFSLSCELVSSISSSVLKL